MNKTAFIVNGRRSIIRRFSRDFDRLSRLIDGEYKVFLTSEAGHAKSLGKELANDGHTHIIAVGGDGTLHEVVNGVMSSAQAECIVGLLPAGTANDYAKSIKVDRDLSTVIEKLNQGSSSKVNLGVIRFAHDRIEYFINIADMGLGVDVVKRVNKSAKILGPGLTFTKSIIRSFLNYKNQSISIQAFDWAWEGKINSLVIANGKYFGSGMCIAPDADVFGDDFSVVIIGDVTIRDYLKYVRKIKRGERIDHPAVQYRKATSLRIRSKYGIEADGEYIGESPKSIEIAKRGVSILL